MYYTITISTLYSLHLRCLFIHTYLVLGARVNFSVMCQYRWNLQFILWLEQEHPGECLTLIRTPGVHTGPSVKKCNEIDGFHSSQIKHFYVVCEIVVEYKSSEIRWNKHAVFSDIRLLPSEGTLIDYVEVCLIPVKLFGMICTMYFSS